MSRANISSMMPEMWVSKTMARYRNTRSMCSPSEMVRLRIVLLPGGIAALFPVAGCLLIRGRYHTHAEVQVRRCSHHTDCTPQNRATMNENELAVHLKRWEESQRELEAETPVCRTVLLNGKRARKVANDVEAAVCRHVYDCLKDRDSSGWADDPMEQPLFRDGLRRNVLRVRLTEGDPEIVPVGIDFMLAYMALAGQWAVATVLAGDHHVEFKPVFPTELFPRMFLESVPMRLPIIKHAFHAPPEMSGAEFGYHGDVHTWILPSKKWLEAEDDLISGGESANARQGSLKWPGE